MELIRENKYTSTNVALNYAVGDSITVTVIEPQSGLKDEYISMLTSFGRMHKKVIYIERIVPSDPQWRVQEDFQRKGLLNHVAGKTDLLLFPGGRDVSSSITGQVQHGQGGDDPHYSWMFSTYVEDKCPIDFFEKIPKFGVCLGFQALTHYYSGITLKQVYNHALLKTHEIRYIGGEKFTTVKKEVDINSRHNQGFIATNENINVLTELGATLVIESSEIKSHTPCIEGVYMPELRYAALQGHPESFEGTIVFENETLTTFHGHPLQLEMMGKLLFGDEYKLPEYNRYVHTLAGGAVDELA